MREQQLLQQSTVVGPEAGAENAYRIRHRDFGSTNYSCMVIGSLVGYARKLRRDCQAELGC